MKVDPKMGDHNATIESEVKFKGHAETAEPDASTVQDAPTDKLEASDRHGGHDGAGPSAEGRPILQPDDVGRSQASPSATQSDHGADNVSVGAPSTFSTGLNVCLIS